MGTDYNYDEPLTDESVEEEKDDLDKFFED